MNRTALLLTATVAACASTNCAETGASGGSNVTLADGYPVVDTDQTACYDDASAITCSSAFAGQDAEHEGAVPAYTGNGDGTVTDDVTGLMWQQDPGAKLTLDEALDGAEECRLGGYDDWRLPTIKELYSLILFSGTDPSTCGDDADCDPIPFIDDDVFTFEYGDESAGERLIDAQYASATTYESTTMGGSETVFGVNFADGRIKGYPSGDEGSGGAMSFFVQYVRGNDEYGVNALSDGGDGTVTDEATGLTWMQGDAGGMDWPDALAYCEALSLAGHDDWRLPNAKELQSIVDYSRSPDSTGSAAIDPVFDVTEITAEDGAPDYPFYWSSTTHADEAGGGGWAVYVAFGEAPGWMEDPATGDITLMDVHGAGAQRSDPKTGDPGDYPYGHGPQGDVVRVFNFVRCVR